MKIFIVPGKFKPDISTSGERCQVWGIPVPERY